MPIIEPSGVAPLSFFDGLPLKPLPSPPVIRADAIDPETGDFVSLVSDLDAIDAQVIEALWRVRGSGASVTEDGAQFDRVTKLGEASPTQLESEARTALSRLVRQGDIRVLGVSVTTDNDWAEVEVEYHNMRARDKVKKRKAKRVVTAGS